MAQEANVERRCGKVDNTQSYGGLIGTFITMPTNIKITELLPFSTFRRLGVEMELFPQKSASFYRKRTSLRAFVIIQLTASTFNVNGPASKSDKKNPKKNARQFLHVVEQGYCHDVRVLNANIGGMLLFTKSARFGNIRFTSNFRRLEWCGRGQKIWASRQTVAVTPLLIWMVTFSDCINTWLQ